MSTIESASGPEQAALLSLERSGECRLFSRLFSAPPDAEVVEDIRALGWMGPGWSPDVESLEVEYTRLLSAPGPDAIAAHQSVYTDELTLEPSGPDRLGCGLSFQGGAFRGYLGGESGAQAKQWYEAARFQPDNPAPVMADHIATQLAFLAHAYHAEALSSRAGGTADADASRELRREFYARFTGRWVSAFCGKLEGNAVSHLYRRVGRRLRLLAASISGE